MSEGPQSDHYSYTHYASAETARSFDERRFGGPIGSLIADVQARTLSSFIGRLDDRRILDVGTGTGRAAILFARGGARVTAVDASGHMLEVARVRAAEAGLHDITFAIGDAHALDFRDREFDVVCCLRVLMHTPQWRVALAELCRVADRDVIIDYPSMTSGAAIESLIRRAAYTAGFATEPYRTFTDRAVRKVLHRCGFRVRSLHRQFVLPIALHKAIGSPRFTSWSERALDRVGLLEYLGSPVSLLAERCAS